MIPFNTKVPALTANGFDIVLQPMSVEDAASLATAFSTMSPWSRYPFTPDTLQSYLTEEEAGAPRFAVHVDGGATPAVGALGLRTNWLRGPYIQFLGLTEPFQNRGIGAALLGEVETQARQAGAQNVWVMASQFNDRALDFYRRFGFFPVARIDALVTADQTEVLLRKRLG